MNLTNLTVPVPSCSILQRCEGTTHYSASDGHWASQSRWSTSFQAIPAASISLGPNKKLEAFWMVSLISYGSPMDHLWINYGSFTDKPWIIYYGWFLGHWWMVDGCFMALYGMDFTWNWPCCQFGPERFIACPNKNPGTWTNHLWIPMGPWIYFASPSL